MWDSGMWDILLFGRNVGHDLIGFPALLGLTDRATRLTGSHTGAAGLLAEGFTGAGHYDRGR